MNKKSTDLPILTNRPIDLITVSIITEVKNSVADLGVDIFLVGATARIILLEHVYGLSTGRATRDIDFAFAIKDWDQFEAIKKRLISTTLFVEVKGVGHRLKYSPKEVDLQFVVDLIPFGGIEGKNNVIAWPPELSVLMNVAGFRDAQASAVQVELTPNLMMSIASIPSIAILKLFAWVDRGRENPKDAIDLIELMRQYTNAGNQDRIYEDAIATLETVNYDIELAGAWLLGKDAFALASPETRNQLTTLGADTKLIERLITDMSKAMRLQEDAIAYSRSLLELFFKGFADSPNNNNDPTKNKLAQ